MELNEYQERAIGFAVYPDGYNNLEYVTLGLVGEAGEIANKVKKIQRDPILFSEKVDWFQDTLMQELGDVLWYVSAFAVELGVDLEEVARMNLAKLESRAARDKIQGSGDDR